MKVKAIRGTDKAILVEDEFGEETWVPRSVIDEGESEVSETGDEGEIVVARWWAEKNGWID